MNDSDTPEVEIDYEAVKKEVAELAKLDLLEYEICREQKAKALKIRTSVLDKAVGNQRKPDKEYSETKDELEEGVEPWEYPVDGDEIAKVVKDMLNRHLILPAGADVAITLWLIASYAIDAFRIFPKVLLSSPEKRCGKTTTLEVIQSLANRSTTTANASPSVLFRIIEAWQPTLLIDEADTFLDGKNDLRGIINSGHTRSGAYVLRNHEVNGDWVPKRFSTWAPMVIAMIKKPASTIIDRSIVIELQRKMPDQKTLKLPIDINTENEHIRRKIKRWADDNCKRLKVMSPDVPVLKNERAMDNWMPLLAVADLIGHDEIARKAMLKLSNIDDDEPAIEAQLLIDIREILGSRNRIFSGDLVGALIGDEDGPWCEWRHGKPMTQTSLSKLLKPYGPMCQDSCHP